MRKSLSRREFLQLVSLYSLSAAVPLVNTPKFENTDDQKPNFLIIVYDAWSAQHVPLYGYDRITMPNLNRLTARSVVYHQHYSASNYTTPGTASLLTGVYPWTHRAINLNDTVTDEFRGNNIFGAFPAYNSMAFTHNKLADTLLHQFAGDIDTLIPRTDLHFHYNFLVDALLRGDADAAQIGWMRAFETHDLDFNYSLFFANIVENFINQKRARILEPYRATFGDRIPKTESGSYFTLEQSTDTLVDLLTAAEQPFLGYFHFYPPHDPYSPPLEYRDWFYRDGFRTVDKPEHLFTQEISKSNLNRNRRRYDEYLLYVDQEFARLYKYLEKSGLLDNTWILLTSDHGEMFERGILGHITPAIHQPIIRVPLIIFEPGRNSRQDIHHPTSAVDILPTIAHVTGQSMPEWSEGSVLPPYKTSRSNKESVYAMQLRYNRKFGALERGSQILVKGPYKFIRYFGYEEQPAPGEELYELYHLIDDPEELQNLSDAKPDVAAEMLDELLQKQSLVDQRYL